MVERKRILVIGASGQVGGACVDVLKGDFEVVGTYFSHPKEDFVKLDFTDGKAVRELIGKVKPDAVILTAALTNVDYCEAHEEEARKMNVEAVKYVAEACRETGAKLVYISTDYVFDGRDGPYDEGAKPNPISVYGRTKLQGEFETKRAGEWLIIRTGNVFDYGYDEKNFVLRLLERLKAGEQVKVQTDLYATPTLATHIARGIGKLLQMGKRGIYDVAGKETISRHELALLVAGFFKLEESLLVGVKTAELQQPAARPLRGGLISLKMQRETGLEALPLLEALKHIKEKMDAESAR